MPENTTRCSCDSARSSNRRALTGTALVRQLRGAGAIFWSSRGLVLLGVLVAVTIGAIAAFMIWHGRQSALKDHQRGMNSMSVVLAEQTSRYVQVIDLILQEVQARITHLDPASPADFEHQFATQDVHSYLAERLKHIPQADAIVLIDANGRIFNTSRASQARNPDVSDRDYYRYFLEHDDREAFVGSVSKSRGTGELSFFVARRINGSNGQFLGLVLGVVDLKYLTTFYQAAIEKLGETVALCRRDGTMLIRYPDPELAIGMKLAPGLPWHRHVALGGGYYINTAAITGLPSLISVHLLRDYPLVLTLIMTEADALARWHKEALYTAGISIIAALTVAGLFWMLARQFRRQAEHNAELELGRQQVDAVLSNVTHGVCFFDGNKKLRLSNRRYAEIFNLPPEATQVGRSLEELIRFREAAGTAVDMSRSDYLSWRDNLMLTDKPPNAVTALRNGRFVASYYQAMPDGGWVATHEDITERQHAEASIVFMARHDALTKLPNRMLFKERMEQAIAMARRGTGFAVLCLDLDKFKQVNDTMGHPVGDGTADGRGRQAAGLRARGRHRRAAGRRRICHHPACPPAARRCGRSCQPDHRGFWSAL